MRTRAKTNAGVYPVLLILLVLVAAPLVSVLVTAVTGYRDEDSALHTLFRPEMLRVIWNTVWLSFLVVMFSTLFAAPLAFLRAWTPMRKAEWVEAVSYTHLTLPTKA